ncbi:hypothetical protein C8D88_11689 [Lentzea atacamensis]|uniref:Uncharacterized protein n=1 Tax=Lentzea atacamensis TaxID=531938 RepID=A0A316HNU3_9PSEU|nr:hypothetical protein C8D88_11689 [Lentzea atacamensis]
MTLTLRADCPSCGDEVRVPVLALKLAEGRFLTVDDSPLVEHVKTHEEEL